MDEETKHIVIKIRLEDEARFRNLTGELPDDRLFSQMLDAYEIAQQKSEVSNQKLEEGTLAISSAEEKPPARVKRGQSYRALHGKAVTGIMPGLRNRGKMGFPDF